jgi:NOL1/NOP2/fmu family ribosome biogenesis protein
MKKNLRFVLALTLGLATTVSAQDWSVDSRTRVNSTEIGTESQSINENLTRLGVSFGSDAVGVHLSTDYTTILGSSDGMSAFEFTPSIHEAYLHSNVMEYGSIKAGRMALNFGSGRIIGSNDFNLGGNTWDGALIGINNDFADLHLGYASTSYEDTNVPAYELSRTQLFLNVAKDFDALSFNFIYSMDTEVETGFEDFELTNMGLDASYAMSNGANINFGYFTAANGTDSLDMDLITIGVDYAVNDQLTVYGSYDQYGDNGFYLASGSFGDQLGSAMNYSSFTSKSNDINVGGTYTMGDFELAGAYHMVSDETSDANASDNDYNVLEASASYNLSDNSSVKLNYSTSDEFGDDAEITRMWLSLHVGF